MAREESKKSYIGFVIGTVVVVALVITFVVSIAMTSAHTTKAVGNMDEFRSAIKEKKAVNCVVTHDEDGDFLIQANDGFGKIKMIIYDSGGEGLTENMLTIDDVMYYWDSDGNAMKMMDSSTLNELVEALREGADDEYAHDDYRLSCDLPSKSDFAVPSLDFVDASE